MKKNLFSLLCVTLLSWTAASAQVFISEIADPADGGAYGRFVELFNAGDSDVDFDSEVYYLVQQSQGTTTFRRKQLSGTIASRSTYLVTRHETNFLTQFPGATIDLLGGLTTHTDGDDAFYLYKDGDESTGVLIDIYGEKDVDGTGTAWEFSDGRAFRKSNIANPNAIFTLSEWDISTGSTNKDDCTPNVHEGGSVGPDLTAPAWYGDPPAITNVQIEGFDITLSLDEMGKVFYVVVPDGADAPTPAEVVAGADYGTVTLIMADTIEVESAFSQYTEAISGLEWTTAYDMYLVAEDDEETPNQQDAVTILEATTLTPDLENPVWTNGFPKASDAQDIRFKLVVNLDEICTAYFILVPDGATAPTSEEVKAGEDYGDVVLLQSGAISVYSADKDIVKVISDLKPGMNYDVYVVAVDDAVYSNLQDTPVKVDVSTLASYDGPILYPQYGVPGPGKCLMTIGQDIETVHAYASSQDMPVPGGVVSYVSAYYILSSSYPQWGALGVDNSLDPYMKNGEPGMINWGAGRLSAYLSEIDFPNSSLVIALNLAEDQWNPTGLSRIIDGELDAEIVHLARFCEELVDGPVYLRIGYEFDGTWNGGYSDRDRYIAAYKRIASMVKANATNVVTVWQSSSSPIDDAIENAHEDITSWYPGDEYVDMMGMSYFMGPGETKEGVPSQLELSNEVLEYARERRKPVMICEAAPQGYDIGQLANKNITPIWDGVSGQDSVHKHAIEIWDEWFDSYFNFIYSNNDVIRVTTYIDTHWDTQGKWRAPYPEGYWGDSRVQANDSIFAFWKNELSKEFWLHGSADLNELLSGADITVSVPKMDWSDATPKDSSFVSIGSTINIGVDVAETVDSVSLWIGTQYIGTDDEAPYEWNDLTSMVDLELGFQIIGATAYAADGGMNSIGGVFYYTENQVPVIEFAGPTPGENAILSSGVDVDVSANISDLDGTVEEASLFVNGELVSALTESPFSWTGTAALSDLASGVYILHIKATDDAEETASSERLFIVKLDDAGTCSGSGSLGSFRVVDLEDWTIEFEPSVEDVGLVKVNYFDPEASVADVTTSFMALSDGKYTADLGDGLTDGDDLQFWFTIIETDSDELTSALFATSIGLDCDTGIEPGEELARIEVYPNPSKGILFIENLIDINKLTLCDATGRTVMQKKCSGESSLEISLDLETGLYFLVFDSDGKREVRSIIFE